MLAFADPGAPTIALDEIPHPGTLRCVAISDGRFDVVNHVLVESYLPGVLAGELYSHWKPTTFASQAIAARSFACAERVIFARTRHYDLVNTAASQMYVGSAAERRPHDAVEATRGVVLSYADALVPGYYSSCCGGRAAAAPDAIGSHPLNTLPPLQGRDLPDVCGNAPLYRWKMERSKDDVVRRIAAWGRSRKSEDAGAVRSLAGVDVEEVNPHGRPRRYRVRSTKGDGVVLDAEDLRQAVDYSTGGMSAPARRLWSAYLEIDVGRTRVEFAGRGHGHGVGLCQYGAEELAQNGRTFEEILAWYYPSVRLTQAFGGSLAAR